MRIIRSKQRVHRSGWFPNCDYWGRRGGGEEEEEGERRPEWVGGLDHILNQGFSMPIKKAHPNFDTLIGTQLGLGGEGCILGRMVTHTLIY